MFIITAKLLPRRAVAAIAGALILIGVCALAFATRPSGQAAEELRAATAEERVAYLTRCGWEIEPQPIETLQMKLPDPLEEPYISYNMLQKEQGFDLTPYCGKRLQRYTYLVRNYPGRSDCQANLYLADGTIVAGDIVCTGEDGFMQGLRFPEEKKQRGK